MLTALHSLFQFSDHARGMTKLANLRKIVASAATMIAGNCSDVASLEEVDDFMSDSGDWSRSEASQNTLDWFYANKPRETLFTPRGLVSQVLPTTSMHVAASDHKLTTRHDQEILPYAPGLTKSNKPKTHRRNLSKESGVKLNSDGSANQAIRSVQSTPYAKKQTRDSPQIVTAKTIPKPEKKQRNKRFSWFQSSKSASSLQIRSPTMEDVQATSLTWRETKWPRRFKLAFVEDGARGFFVYPGPSTLKVRTEQRFR